MRLRGITSGLLVLVGCNGDTADVATIGASESSAGESSTSDVPATGSTDGSSSSGAVLDDSSSSGEADTSSESTGGQPTAVLRTLLVDDLDGDGQWWAYMVEWSGDEVSPPIPVHGPLPADVVVDVDAVSDELAAISTTTADGARTWTLVEIDGNVVGASGPLALAPAPTASTLLLQIVPEDSRAVFSACESIEAPCSLWSTIYDGAAAQPPERVSPLAPTASYDELRLAPAADAVLARRVEDGGISNLVWMPLAPIDPDAAVVLTTHTESWQSVSGFRVAADGDAVYYLASVSAAHDQLFVDDLDEGTPALAVHPGLAAEHTVRSLRVAPDGGAFAYWVGSYDPPTPVRGDVYVATVDGTTVGVPIDVAAADGTASAADLAWSPDSRWLVYQLNSDEPRNWLARFDGDEVARFMLPDSGTSGAAFDDDAHFLYYVTDDGRLRRIDVADDVPGVVELVTETPAAGGVQVTSDSARLTFVGNDLGGHWAAYLLETARLPAFTMRIDVPPQPDARLSPTALMTMDQRFVMTHEFIDPGVPALVHSTRVAEPGVTVTLGASIDGTYATLPTPER